MRIKPAGASLALPILALGVSCASIVGTPNHVMPIRSLPSEADVLIKDESGAEMFKGKTPTTVTLPKSTGKYWGKKTYEVTLKKEGFQEQKFALTANANGWYVGGNIVFGGLIGWFLVDPFSGKMYNMAPETITANLAASALPGDALPTVAASPDSGTPQQAPAAPDPKPADAEGEPAAAPVS